MDDNNEAEPAPDRGPRRGPRPSVSGTSSSSRSQKPPDREPKGIPQLAKSSSEDAQESRKSPPLGAKRPQLPKAASLPKVGPLGPGKLQVSQSSKSQEPELTVPKKPAGSQLSEPRKAAKSQSSDTQGQDQLKPTEAKGASLSRSSGSQEQPKPKSRGAQPGSTFAGPRILPQSKSSESEGLLEQKSSRTETGIVPNLLGILKADPSKSSRSQSSQKSKSPEPRRLDLWKFLGTQKTDESGLLRDQKQNQPKPSLFHQLFPSRSDELQGKQSSKLGLSIFGNHRRKNIAYASAMLLAGLSVAALIRPGSDEGQSVTPKPKETTCNTQGCHLVANVLKKLEVSTSICDDFFTAVCSNKEAGGADQFPGDNITSEQSRLAEIEETIFMDKLVKFAVPDRRPENLTGQILDSEMQMGKFFLSCHNRDESADDARRFFLRFLDELGIPMGSESDKQYMSMFSACVRLSLVWGIDNPLFFVKLKPLRGTKYYLTVIRTLKKDFDVTKIDIPILKKRRAAEYFPTTDELRDRVVQFVNETIHWYHEKDLVRLNDTVQILTSVFPGRHALEAEYLREMVLNYEAVVEFLQWRVGLMADGEPKEPLRAYFSTLEETTSFPWRRAITYGVRQYLNLSRHSQVYVERPDVAFEMAQLLMDPRLHRVFRHYLYIWLLDKLRYAMGKEPEASSCAEKPHRCLYLKEEKERYCFRKTREYFPRSYVSLVSRSLVHSRTRIEVKFILSLLILQSARMLRYTSFMEDKDKLRAFRLLATMVVYDGSPEYLDEMRAVEYKFEIGRNFFQNIMMIRRNRNEEKLITFERLFYVTSARWPHMPISLPQAYYDIDLNSLTVPATLMTFPHHVPGAPLWFTLAGIGWNVVHKLFHVFDTENRGNPFIHFMRNAEWDNKTEEKFKEISKCFHTSYTPIKAYYPSHMSFVDEAVLDNAAVYVLSQAFGFIERQMGRTLLPHATGYDYPDVYWIAAVKPFCYTTYVYADKVRNHLFSRSRINYALRDLKQFPEGFKCAEGSFMIDPKCQAWGV